MHPNLGVVRVGPEQSFVVADLPGLIEGASEGAGLGHLFLRHLQRTRLLLHVVDLAPFDESVDPVAQAKAIVGELKKYDAGLFDKPRWLVLNKLDLVPEDEREKKVKAFVKAYRWKGPVFAITAINGEGCRPLIFAVQEWLDAHPAAPVEEMPDDDATPGVISPAAVIVTPAAGGVAPESATAPVVMTPAPVAPRRRRGKPESAT